MTKTYSIFNKVLAEKTLLSHLKLEFMPHGHNGERIRDYDPANEVSAFYKFRVSSDANCISNYIQASKDIIDVSLNDKSIANILPKTLVKSKEFQDTLIGIRLVMHLHFNNTNVSSEADLNMALDHDAVDKYASDPKTANLVKNFLTEFKDRNYEASIIRPFHSYNGTVSPNTQLAKILGPAFRNFFTEHNVRTLIRDAIKQGSHQAVEDYLHSLDFGRFKKQYANLMDNQIDDLTYQNQLAYGDQDTIDEVKPLIPFLESHRNKFSGDIKDLKAYLVPTNRVKMLIGHCLNVNASDFDLIDLLNSELPTEFIINQYTPNFHLNPVNLNTTPKSKKSH